MISYRSRGAGCDCLPSTDLGGQLVPQISHTCHTHRNLRLQLRKTIQFLPGLINRGESGHN